MAKYRVITFYTASISTDVIADSEGAACELVRADETPVTQDSLRNALDDIQESWTQHRRAFNFDLL